MGFSRIGRVCLLSICAVFGTVLPALAEEKCGTVEGVWLDLTPTDDGYLVPIGIAGTPRLFLLESSSAYATLDEKISQELKLPTKGLPNGVKINEAGVALTKIAIVPTVQIGVATRSKMEFLTRPHNVEWGPRADGMVGMNVFYGLDFELDLADNKLGLLIPRDCPFTPYWSYERVGNARIKIEPTGTTTLPMTLDGQNIEVSIATSDRRSYMSLHTAKMLFGIDENDKDLIPAGAKVGGKPLFRYPFKALAADDVVINNPDIYLVGGSDELCGGVTGRRYNALLNRSCFGGADVQLGIKELRQLHFYFALKEKRVYFTPAKVTAAVPADSATGAPTPLTGSGSPH